MILSIRPGRPSDADEVAAVCRATALSGEPQVADHPDPDLVALVYARPYLAMEPATSRVLGDGTRIVGYVLGALDSVAFYVRWEQEWAPRHLPRPCSSDTALVHQLEHPMAALPPGVDDYPSHLHVNLLPEARGCGQGRRLVADFVAGLRAAGSPGVHLRVGRANVPAQRFYRQGGFRYAAHGSATGALTMVRGLTPGGGPAVSPTGG